MTTAPTADRATGAPRPRRWVDAEIARLDPEHDYEQILRLVAEYRLDFLPMNLVLLVSTAGAVMNPEGARTLVGTGKMLHRSERRFDDGNGYFFAWLVDGVNSEAGIAATERLNRYHLGVAREHPAAFGQDEDYLYTLAALAVFGERMRRALDLPPEHPNVAIAWHHALRDLCSRLVGTHGPVTGFPDDYAGLLAMAEEWEARSWQTTPEGLELINGMTRQLCERFFPRPLHWFGRTLVQLVTPEPIRRVHRMGDPGPVAGPVVKALFRRALLAQAKAPDPALPFSQRRTSPRAAQAADKRRARMARVHESALRTGALSTPPTRTGRAEAARDASA
ncbi:hypothetical protein [Nocardioides sp. GY 10127]|uniref:hypothetical protein n=1 Tax=Nocardioides sp. GY 10127 TaxID=2569762 RepID=UPI0010A91A35|nr:hypothetical protein [Nocardioides sp. GY 10127]TIC82667.1 hypothetical protein E8D37_08155 [Nocardioides sp. GY 10127]